MNRIFGLQTQWRLRISLQRLRAPVAMTVLAYSAIGTAFDSVGLKAALPNDLNKGC